MAKKVLQREVAAKYKLVGIIPGTYQFDRFGRIDLCAMTITLADQLAAAGAPFLALKKKRLST